jgi:hypothetical protein
MTQKVITLIWYKDLWRLKTPSGDLFDAYFKGTKTDAKEWARVFTSSWLDITLNFQEIEDATPSGMP